VQALEICMFTRIPGLKAKYYIIKSERKRDPKKIIKKVSAFSLFFFNFSNIISSFFYFKKEIRFIMIKMMPCLKILSLFLEIPVSLRFKSEAGWPHAHIERTDQID
jgi:Na+/alanine symporter